jgi:GT2 family glycosyltransferase
MRPALTVGITTRNRPDALAACLASLAMIAHLEPEVLVFDDGSQPQVDAPVHVIRDERSPGYIVGRNRIVREAAGEFVLLMDDDARLIDGAAVDEALAVLRGDPGVGAVALAQAEADGRPWPATMQPSAAQVPSVVPSFIGFAHIIRRDGFLALGGYREAFGCYGEEKEFCLRLLDAGLHTVYLPHALVAHVVDPNSRDRRRYLRFVARNDCLNSLLNDPFTRLVWMLPARYALYFRMRRGWKIRDPWGGVWLLGEIAGRLSEVWRARRPVSRETLKEWRALRSEPRLYRGSGVRDQGSGSGDQGSGPLQPDGVGGR